MAVQTENSAFVVTLQAYAAWLDREIERVDHELRKACPDLEREVERTYIGPDRSIFGPPISDEQKNDPKNWQEIETTAVLLDGLRCVVATMLESVGNLKGQSNE